MKPLAGIIRTAGQLVVFLLILTATGWRWGLLPGVSWGAILDVGLAVASVGLLISFVRVMVTGPDRRRREALVRRLTELRNTARKGGKA